MKLDGNDAEDGDDTMMIVKTINGDDKDSDDTMSTIQRNRKMLVCLFCRIAFELISSLMDHGRRLSVEFGDGKKFCGPTFRITSLGQNFHFNAKNF